MGSCTFASYNHLAALKQFHKIIDEESVILLINTHRQPSTNIVGHKYAIHREIKLETIYYEYVDTCYSEPQPNMSRTTKFLEHTVSQSMYKPQGNIWLRMVHAIFCNRRDDRIFDVFFLLHFYLIKRQI